MQNQKILENGHPDRTADDERQQNGPNHHAGQPQHPASEKAAPDAADHGVNACDTEETYRNNMARRATYL